jgi:hypothetical protein
MFVIILGGIWLCYGGTVALYCVLPLLGLSLVTLGSRLGGGR